MKEFPIISFFLLVTLNGITQVKKKNSVLPPPPYSKNIKQPDNPPQKDLTYLVPKLSLKPDTVTYAPRKFYLADIKDSSGTDSIGYAILPRDYKKQKIGFDGDKETLLFNYMKSIIATDSSLYPVKLKVIWLRITEKQKTKAEIEADFELKMEIYCRVKEEWIFLDWFSIGGGGQIYVGSPRKYDSLLKSKLKLLPEKIDETISYAESSHLAFSKGVRVTTAFQQSSDNDENDTLIIDNKRYLQWSDYRAVPISVEGCYSSTTIFMDDERDYKDRYFQVKLTIAPVLFRKKSWVGEEVKTGRLLNHEHYQAMLTYLYALKLKKELDSFSFTLKKVGEEVEAIYSRINDEMRIAMQKYYYETRGGEKTKEQNAWEDKIELQIKQPEK
ncbi:MAG TPA: hypothetical protein VIV35_01825 [Chitinophagaceae bacterium]